MKRAISKKLAARPATTSEALPPTNLKVEVTRALDQELAWFFGYAETARRVGGLTLLPPFAAKQATDAGETEEDQVRRAEQLAQTVQLAVRKVPTYCAGVLRAVYTPRRWPRCVVREFGSLSAIAVRLVRATEP
jgi:hypothetical protein